jgi:hypothetical protein
MQNILIPAALIGGVNLGLRGISKDKDLPLTMRMAAKSLAWDKTPFTKDDLTQDQINLLKQVKNNSEARYSNKKTRDEYGYWLTNTSMSTQDNLKQALGKADRYDQFTFKGQTGTLPQHRAYYTYLDSEGIQPIDYWNTINITSGDNKTYGGNMSIHESLVKMHEDPLFDLYHGIGRATIKNNTVNDTYDLGKMSGKLREHNNKGYNIVHDIVRTFGKPYPVNIDLGE